MKKTLAMFNIPNLFTATNMLCGAIAILLSLTGRIDIAPFVIYLGAILDFFDGFLARLLKQQGELGKQMDSLADMITFGLAPGMMMMVLITYIIFPKSQEFLTQEFSLQVQIALQDWLNKLSRLSSFSYTPFAALIIPFFSLFRLAKFNIDTRQTDSFIGLNTPANTIFFSSIPLLCSVYLNKEGMSHNFLLNLLTIKSILPLIIIMSLLLISEIHFFSLKIKHFKWNGNQLRFLFLITCLVLIFTLVVWSIPIIILLYIVLSLIENLIIKNKPL
jgi:CDP-diacylglycerol--serine O-phosphatidyltransferase